MSSFSIEVIPYFPTVLEGRDIRNMSGYNIAVMAYLTAFVHDFIAFLRFFLKLHEIWYCFHPQDKTA